MTILLPPHLQLILLDNSISDAEGFIFKPAHKGVYWMVMLGSSSCEFSGEMDLGGQMMQPEIWISSSLPFALFAARFVLRKLILWDRMRAIDPIGLIAFAVTLLLLSHRSPECFHQFSFLGYLINITASAEPSTMVPWLARTGLCVFP